MKRFSFASLRVRLILLVLFAILPALGIILYTGLVEWRQARLRAMDYAIYLARDFSENQDRLIQNARQILFALSRIPQVRDHDIAGCTRIFADLMKESEGYAAFLAVKPNGDIFATNRPLERPINLSDRPYIQRVLKTRDFVIGEYQIGRITGKAVIVLAYPALDEKGNLRTILGAGLDLEWIGETLPGRKLPEGTSVSVLDRNGTVLFRHPESEKFVGKSMPESPIFKRIFEKKEGAMEELDLDGVLRLFGFCLLGKGEESVYVSVGVPTKIALAHVYDATRKNLTFLGLIGALALAVAWFGGDLFVRRPVTHLIAVTKRLSEGDLNARSRPSSERGEIGQLAQAFDQMAESLERREAERKRAEEGLRRSEEEAKRLAKEAVVLAEIGRIVSSTLNIEEVYERVAEEVHKLVPFELIIISIINREDRTFTIPYVAGSEMPSRKKGDVIPLDGSAAEWVLQTWSSLLIHNAKLEGIGGRIPGLLPMINAGYKSMIIVPLIFKDNIIGVLGINLTKPDSYGEKDLILAERVSTQIAGAIANAQLFLELKRAEEGLRESERRYRLIADNAQDVISTADRNLRINYVSPSVTRMRGYTVEEVLGQTPEELYTPESRQLMMKVLAEESAIEKREEKDLSRSRTVELEVKSKDGSTYWAETKLSFLRDVDGQWIGILGVGRDITERKRAEEEKTTLQEQLRQSQKMEAIGQLAGGIAHDFNNLLTIMKGHSQLALMDLKEGDQFREVFQSIEEATTKSANLVRQILAFSRRQVMEMIVLDLNNLLKNLEKMLRRIIGEDIELLTVLADDLGRVKADPGQIEQVIFNLAVNARDAMPKGGKLTIETANVELDEAYAHRHVAVTPGRYVMIALSDTGVGMTPEIRERVFEPFFTTKEKGKGTGLGLATVYGIVKQSGGNIWVYSEPGQGATFKIYLPRVDELLTKEVKKEETGLFRGVGVILVVEDDEGVRKLVLEMLKKQGYSVLEAGDEEEALLICQRYKDKIHLMVTDVVMPKISGPELAKRLVAYHPEMKVLYMSGYTDNAIVHHGVLDKGVNYIQKPFTFDGLARKVREVLDKETKPVI